MSSVWDPLVRSTLAGELSGVRSRLAELERESAGLRARESALVLLLGSSAARALSGDSLREAVRALLEERDPQGRGMHYTEIARLLQEGYRINGVDPTSTLRATIGGGKGRSMFRSVGSGRYALR